MKQNSRLVGGGRVAALLVWAFAPLAMAAPPANDSFSTPVVLGDLPVSISTNNIDATLEAGEPSAWGYEGASVWFRWTAASTETVQIDTLGSDFDTMLAIWSGDELATLTPLASNDDSGSPQSRVIHDVEAGVTYQIAVYGYSSAQGNITLNLASFVESKITGTVTDGTNGIENIDVQANRWNGNWWENVSGAYTGPDGSYEIGGLAAGTYRVVFSDANGEYAAETYGDVPGHNLDSGLDILIGEGSVVLDINAVLSPASWLTGMVIFSEPGEQMVSVQPYLLTESGWVNQGFTVIGTNGYYEFGGLAAGTYHVAFIDWSGNYALETYNNIPGQNIESGTDIILAAASIALNINASLSPISQITGTVTDGTTGIQDVYVYAYLWNGEWWDWAGSSQTDTNGFYEIGGLVEGTYRLEFYAQDGNYVSGVVDSIVVGAGVVVSDIDSILEEYASLSGTVTQADGTTPISGVLVRLKKDDESWEYYAWADENGHYAFNWLYPGNYTLKTTPVSGIGYLGEWYNSAGLYIPGQDAPPPEAEVITLGSGEERTGINFALDPAGRITGTVIGNGGTPIAGVVMKAKNATHGIEFHAATDGTGTYDVMGLLPGSYTLKAAAQDYGDEWWDDASHENQARAFDVDSGDTLTRDFDLQPGQHPALVEVRCDPEVNALIYLDYQSTLLVTPAVVDIGEVASHAHHLGGWTVASHVITLKKDDKPRPAPRTAPGVEAETVTLTFDMTSPAAGSISIATEPSDAEVFIDYADVADGLTPLTVNQLAPGSHTLLLRKAGYLQPRPIIAYVTADATTDVTIPLATLSSEDITARIQSTPTNAQIYVDYLPTVAVTDAEIDWMDPASHAGSGWHSASHAIMLRRPGSMWSAPRYVPESTGGTASLQLDLIEDVVAAVDENGDGLPDQWQEASGLLDFNPEQAGPNDDPDGDGLSNEDEMHAGTDPTSAASVLALTDLPPLSETGITLVFTSVPGRRYLIQSTANIQSGDWTNLSGILLATDEQTTYTAPMPDLGSLNCYRLIVLVP